MEDLVLKENVRLVLSMLESTLIKLCLENDRKAQKELVYNYAPALLSIVRRYVKTDDFAQDYLQETFILIFKNLHQFDATRAKLFTWMRTITINNALRQISQEKNRYNGHLIVEETEAESVIEQDNSLMNLECEYLIQLIQDLEEPYRTIFNLYAIDGYSHEEIGAMLTIGVSTSRSYLFRARVQLMNKLSTHKNEVYGKQF